MTKTEEITIDEWQEESTKGNSITVEELDEICRKYKLARDEYDAAKEVSDRAYAERERLQGKVVEAMELAGKSKYVVEGVGTLYFNDKMSVRVPKDIESKKLLFKFLLDKYGPTVYWDKVSIHSATLNSFYNEELAAFNEAAKTGTVNGDFNFPGVEAPTAMRSLGLRSEKKPKE